MITTLSKDDKPGCWNNVLLNFNKTANYPVVLVRTGGSLAIRGLNKVYLFKDIFVPEEENRRMENCIGTYECIDVSKNAPPVKLKVATYDFDLPYRGEKLELRLEMHILDIDQKGVIEPAIDMNMELNPYFTDLGRCVMNSLRILMDNLSQVDKIAEDKLKADEEREDLFTKVLKFFFPPKKFYFEGGNPYVQWHKWLLKDVDLTKMVYKAFKTVIYEPTKGNTALTSMFLNKLLIFRITTVCRIEEPK